MGKEDLRSLVTTQYAYCCLISLLLAWFPFLFVFKGICLLDKLQIFEHKEIAHREPLLENFRGPEIQRKEGFLLTLLSRGPLSWATSLCLYSSA